MAVKKYPHETRRNLMGSVGQRIREIREGLGFSYTEFAKFLDEKRQRIADVEQERQRAPEDFLTKIVKKCHINGTWLLTGEGRKYDNISESLEVEDKKYSNDLPASTIVMNSEMSIRDYQEKLQREVVQELGIGRVALFAQRGRCASAWRILYILELAFPKALTITELAVALKKEGYELQPHEIASEVMWLISGHYVVEQETGEIRRYRATTASGVLQSNTNVEVSQHALEAVRVLFQVVLPAVESKTCDSEKARDGKMLTSIFQVPKGQAREFMESIRAKTLKECEEASCDDDGEKLALVFGIGIQRPES